MKIIHCLTTNDPLDQPWPPATDPDHLWVVVQTTPNYTLWRWISSELAEGIRLAANGVTGT